MPKGAERHGIAAGKIRYYTVTGPTWASIQRVIKDYYHPPADQTIGFTNVGPDTVDSFTVDEAPCWFPTIKPMPRGWRPPEEAR